jgi:hypothetical protein
VLSVEQSQFSLRPHFLEKLLHRPTSPYLGPGSPKSYCAHFLNNKSFGQVVKCSRTILSVDFRKNFLACRLHGYYFNDLDAAGVVHQHLKNFAAC